MAEKQNLQSAQVIARLFGITPDEVEALRRKRVITGTGSPKQYDLIPTIQDYVKHLQSGVKYCTAHELADLFGFDGTRRIEQLKSDGIIRGEGKPTRYILTEVVKMYVEFLSDKAYGRDKKETDAQLETEKLTAEKRIKTAKAEMAELELKEMKGELHRASDVEAITTDHVLYLRSMLMAMPGKLAVDVAALKSAPECAERIKQEVYSVLNACANYRYDPDEYKKRVRERQGWNDRHGEEGDE